MAELDFQEKVEALTGLTIDGTGINPSTDQLSQFLTDGGRDVITRSIDADPSNAMAFSAKGVAITDGNGQAVANPKYIISAYREDGTVDSLRSATMISPGLQSLAASEDSLHYRSEFNPGYYYEDGNIFILPIPAASPNRGYVDSVSFPTVVLGDDTIANFPDNLMTYVSYYGSMQVLLSAMGKVISEIGDYVEPKIGSDNTKAISELDTTEWTQVDFDFDGENIEPLKWFQVAGDMIQRQQDPELAKSQLEKIATYLKAYETAITENNQVYKTDLEKNAQDYGWMKERYIAISDDYYNFFEQQRAKRVAKQQAQQQQQQQFGQQARRG